MYIAGFAFRSVRTKFVVTYSVMTICFVLILFAVLYFKERQRIFSVALENSIQLSNLHSDVISQELQRHVASLQTISGHQRVQEGDIDFIVEELKWLKSMSKKSVINTLFVDEHWNLIDHKSRTIKIEWPEFVEDARWKSADYHITAPHVGLLVKTPVVALGVPVYDEADNWKGIVGVSISVDYLAQRLSKVKLGNSSYAWISDSSGTVVSHPDSSLILHANIFEGERVGFEGFADIAVQTNWENVGHGHYYDRKVNEAKIVTFAKIDTLPNWTLFVTTEESDIFLDINELLEDVAITSSVVIVVFMPIVFYLTNSITRPILELTYDVENAVNNHYTTFSGYDSKDEIGQLSNAFKNTFDEIHQHNRKLEEVVALRTQELNTANQELAYSVNLLNANNHKLTWLAMHDPLTNLFNRRALITKVNEQLQKARAHSWPVSLILLDLDHFKEVNDTYGHDVGDDVLKHIADFLAQDPLEEGMLARWGGEEFVIVASKVSLEKAKQWAQSRLEALKDEDFSPVLKVTFSAGIATLELEDSFDELVARADKALYVAKNAGRNCVKTERDSS